jgi:FAD/FMN-containing dehydrogenase
MAISNTVPSRRLESLRTGITGEVFGPTDAGYNQARQAWNLAVDQRPAAVVVAHSAADVVEAVRFARAEGMRWRRPD